MIKRTFPWLILVLIAAGGLLWWRHARAQAEDSAIIYRTAVVQRGDVTQTVAASGALSAITTVEIGSQVSGQIAKLHADFNANVKADQLVAEIEPSTYESRVLQADADLGSARATLELKQLNARRAEELLRKALIARADFDQAYTELRQQESIVRVKEAALKSAQVDLDRTKIRSPIDGVVISRDVNIGQTVQASFNAPKLFTVAKDLRAMQISASVSEADIGGVEAGQTVTFTVDAFPGHTFGGEVREVRNNPTTANNVVNYSTIIDVANPDLKLRPGMTANVTITIAKRTGVLRVPNAAMRFRPPDGAIVAEAGGEKPHTAAPLDARGPEPVKARRAAPVARADFQERAPQRGGEGPDLDRMPPEISDRILAKFDTNKDGQLDARERKAMREARMAASGGGGMVTGGGGPEGGVGMVGSPPRPRPLSSSAAPTRTLYVVSGRPDRSGRVVGTLTAVTVRAGLSDSSTTEVLSGLDEGAVIATGTSTTAPVAAETTNPFAPRPPTKGGGGRGG